MSVVTDGGGACVFLVLLEKGSVVCSCSCSRSISSLLLLLLAVHINRHYCIVISISSKEGYRTNTTTHGRRHGGSRVGMAHPGNFSRGLKTSWQ